MKNKTLRSKRPVNETVRIRLLATNNQIATQLSARSGMKKPDVLGLAIGEGLPLLQQKFAALR